MRIGEFYRQKRHVISFELFPPKTEEGLDNLKARLPRLLTLEPDFVTVTYGAMGTTQERTLEIAKLLRNRWNWDTAHHLTCVGADRRRLERILDQIEAAGIENIVALRGDPPSGKDEFVPPEGGYRHAAELVRHIRRRGNFGIAVAGYPEKHVEAVDADTDLRFLKKKVDCGADVVMTQLFYDNRHYFDFVQRCRKIGIQQPIIPGLLPILSLKQVQRITRMCGASIPRQLLARLDAVREDQPAVRAAGIEHTANQAIELLEKGAPGIHFYVLNRCFHIQEIMQRLEPVLGKRAKAGGG